MIAISWPFVVLAAAQLGPIAPPADYPLPRPSVTGNQWVEARKQCDRLLADLDRLRDHLRTGTESRRKDDLYYRSGALRSLALDFDQMLGRPSQEQPVRAAFTHVDRDLQAFVGSLESMQEDRLQRLAGRLQADARKLREILTPPDPALTRRHARIIQLARSFTTESNELADSSYDVLPGTDRRVGRIKRDLDQLRDEAEQFLQLVLAPQFKMSNGVRDFRDLEWQWRTVVRDLNALTPDEFDQLKPQADRLVQLHDQLYRLLKGPQPRREENSIQYRE